MEQYKRDHEGKYPIPTPGADKNLSCFYLDTAYAHDCDDKTDFIQSQIDDTLLTKRYLQEVPTDPRTGARYAYGVTTDGQYYQIAGLIENDDGTYSAKVAGNLHFTYPLKSLIRSYNSPDFVMDGESWLPYSPDHLALTATIQSITGTVEVDAKPASDGDTISPGSVITTAPASSAILYFSDGSITYLDPETTLRLLPNSEVERNDKDGIITKIRLKLTSGKIWNKVIRLAEKSEFNIETTSAIAGVRGTEFGIDAVDNKIIVLSGTVAARMLTGPELALASSSDHFEFDNGPLSFKDPINQEAKGSGTAFQNFTIGSSSAGTVVTNPATLSDLTAHYETPYTNAHQLRILEIDIPNNILSLQLIQKAVNSPFPFPEPDKVLVFDENDNLLETWHSPSHYTVDSVNGSIDILSSAATTLFTKSVIFAFEDKNGNLTAKSSPAVTLNLKTHVTYAMFYGDETPKKKAAVCGNNIKEASEQCDDGNTFAYDKCDNSCKLTDIVVYTDFGGTTPSAVPDFAEGSINANLSGTVTLLANGMKLDPLTDAYIGYTNSTWPDLQKGSMEFIVNGADLKSNPGKEFYLFDMQEFSNALDEDRRIKIRRRVFNDLEFTIRATIGIELIARTTASELTSFPNGQIKIQVIWDVNVANDPDKAVLKIYDGNTLILTKNNIVPGTSPNLGANTLTTYDFFIGSKVGGKDKVQFPGLMSSFVIKLK